MEALLVLADGSEVFKQVLKKAHEQGIFPRQNMPPSRRVLVSYMYCAG